MKKSIQHIALIIKAIFISYSLTAQISIYETNGLPSDTIGYIYNIGGIKFTSNHLNFGFIYKGDTVIKPFTCYNSLNEPVELVFKKLPGHLKPIPESQTLQPRETASFQLVYFSELVDEWDVVVNRVPLDINGKSPNNRFVITANIREDFSYLNDEEVIHSPVASFKHVMYNFGEANQGDKVKYDFVLQNNGESDLIIRELKAACGCTVIEPKKTIISPGNKTKISIVFDSRGFLGKIRKTVTVITNDPKNYKQYLQIEGNVLHR